MNLVVTRSHRGPAELHLERGPAAERRAAGEVHERRTVPGRQAGQKHSRARARETPRTAYVVVEVRGAATLNADHAVVRNRAEDVHVPFAHAYQSAVLDSEPTRPKRPVAIHGPIAIERFAVVIKRSTENRKRSGII